MNLKDLDPRGKGPFFKGLVAAVAILILGGVLAYCTNASALTIPKDQAKCEALAYDVAYMTQLRDQGVRWADAEAQFRPQAKEVIGAPDSYIADRQDFEYTMQAFQFAFKSDLSAMQAAQIAYNRCMQNLKIA